MLNKVKTLISSPITYVPESLNKLYFPELDGFRGIAILAVIFSHAVLNKYLGKYAVGNIGVEIFFVLSGFLISTLLLKEKIKNGKVSFKKFYTRRGLRILPVAYLFLGVLIFLNFAFNLKVSFGSLIVSALFIKNLPFNYVGNWFNGHFWTLAIEEQFYLIFPFLLIYSLKNYFRVLVFLVLFIPVLQFVGFHNIGIFYTNYPLHKTTFVLITLFGNGTTAILIGSLLSILMFKGLMPVSNTNNYRFLSLVLFIIAMMFRIGFNILPGTYLTSTIFSLVIAFVIFLCITNDNDFLGKILKSKILIKLGILSYSIYIWQQLFMYQQPWGNSFKYSDSLFLNIPVLFIVAYISYHFYEVRFLKLKNKFKAPLN